MQTCAIAETVRIGRVAKATSASRQCRNIPIRTATATAALSCIKIESRLLNAALTNVASFAKRMDNVSALLSSSSNHPTSLRNIAVTVTELSKTQLQTEYELKRRNSAKGLQERRA